MVYLEMVKDLYQLVLGFKNVPIAKEFLNVLSEELTEIPPNKEIEFTIDLVPGTKHISIPLYWMAPVELKELKVQL